MRVRAVDQTGSVTAELAIVIPAVLLILAFAVSAVTAAGQQLSLTSIATDAARQLARGSDAASVESAIHRQLGDSSSMRVEQESGSVCVTVRSATSQPVLRPFLSSISATGCALVDE